MSWYAVRLVNKEWRVIPWDIRDIKDPNTGKLRPHLYKTRRQAEAVRNRLIQRKDANDYSGTSIRIVQNSKG